MLQSVSLLFTGFRIQYNVQWLLQFNDGSMLAITLAKYKLMFDEVDTSGNGTLGAAEIQHFFHK